MAPVVETLDSAMHRINPYPADKYSLEAGDFYGWPERSAQLRYTRDRGALSIQQRFRFEISETSRAQWNDTFRLHRPGPSHRAFCCSGFAAHYSYYVLKEKSKYCLYPKEHSTFEKGRWKTKGGGILFRVESLWMQVKVKNSCELKRYVSQNIRTIRSNSWNCTVNKFGVLANLYSARLCCIHFSLIDKLL